MRQYEFREIGEKADLGELKQHLLQMLIAFDGFCRARGLRYYLSGGTLLGAVRHRGFIPWDDDIDVSMPRPDCERIMGLCGGRIGPYLLQQPTATEPYRCFFYRLYDDSLLLVRRERDGTPWQIRPAFMDIFPIEGMEATSLGTRLHRFRIDVRKAVFYSANDPSVLRSKRRIVRCICTLLRPFERAVTPEKALSGLIAAVRSIPYDQSDFIGVMTNRSRRERVAKREFEPQLEMEFEGHSFMAPAGYDVYLRQLYGEYMRLPPEEQRKPPHHFEVYFRKMGDGKRS